MTAFRFKKWKVYLGLIVITLPALSWAGLGYLPRDWHVLPENINEKSLPPENEKSLQGASKSLSAIYEANQKVLDELNLKARSSWYLKNVETNLMVSGQGLIGLTAISGESTVKLFWKRKNPVKSLNANKANDLDPGGEVIVLNNNMSATDIEKEMEPAVQAAISSGKIKNAGVMRGNLRRITSEFQELLNGIEVKSHLDAIWYVSKLRLDLFVDASGNVTPFTGVGADINFRLDWNLIRPKRKDSTTLKNTDGNLPNIPPMQRFINSMAADLAVLSTSSNKPKSFDVSHFWAGIGLGAGGTIVVSRVTGRIFGRIYFKKGYKTADKSREGLISEPVTDKNSEDEFYLLEEEKIPEHMHFAKSHNIPFSLVEASLPNGQKALGGGERVLYRVSRSAFRKGLNKAMKISNFFLNRANNRPSKGWEIGEIRTLFDLSVTGSLGLASVAGFGVSEIAFIKL